MKKKDIFIDAQIANKFSAPPDKSYKDLIDWLLKNDPEHPENNAYLMVSNHLRKEYWGGNLNCDKPFSITNIYSQLLAEDRLVRVTNAEIEKFLKDHIHNNKKLKINCGHKDKKHFPLIFFSDRKKAIIDDEHFYLAVVNFPKFSKEVDVKRNPQDMQYK